MSDVVTSGAHPPVTVVVVNYNNTDDTLLCLTSVTASKYPALSVVLVDNDSRDDPTEVVMARFPAVHVLRLPTNQGYGGGMNAGITWAVDHGAAYVLLLNNDTVILPDMIQRLVDVAERHTDAGFVTPKIFLDGRGSVYWAGGTVDWRAGDFKHEVADATQRGVKESAWSNGCAPLVRAATIRDIGLMDPSLFLYCEDVDWSVRASRAGWRHLVALDAVCWHKVSGTSGGAGSPLPRYYFTRNRYRVLARYDATHRGVRGGLRYARRLLREYSWFRGDVGLRQAILEAGIDLARRRAGPRPRRRAVTIALSDAVMYAVASAAEWFGRARQLVR